MTRSDRLARPLTYLGILAVVLVWSKLHAAVVASQDYDFTASARLGWALAFVAMCCVAAYALGLPDLVRSRRALVASCVSAPVLGALALSVLQLALGVPLLPRFVIGCTVLTLVPWLMLCAGLARGLRTVNGDRERVVVVAGDGEVALLRDELARGAERPAVVVASTTAAVAREPRRLLEITSAHDGTLVVLARDAQVEESVVAQAAELHGRGLRVRTLNQFYEEWLGKMALPELERSGLLFDIRELHAVATPARSG